MKKKVILRVLAGTLLVSVLLGGCEWKNNEKAENEDTASDAQEEKAEVISEAEEQLEEVSEPQRKKKMNREEIAQEEAPSRHGKKEREAQGTVPDYDRYATDLNIAEQSEFHTINPWGEVYFESFRPDTSIDPNGDASFTISHGTTEPIVLEGMTEENERSAQKFQSVDAFAFRDLNDDGYDDIITLCSYVPTGKADSFREVRLYSGSPSGEFTLQRDLSNSTTKALSNPVISDVEQYVRNGHNQFVVSSAAPLVAEKPAANSEDWREAYINYINQNIGANLYTSYAGATLINITDDGIPQLALIGDCEATGDIILTYSNGNVDSLQTSRCYFTYIGGSNLLCNAGGNMGCYYDYVYRIEDGKFVEAGVGTYGDPADGPQMDENGDYYYEYQWNGTPVSEAQYKQELNAIYDTSRAVDGYDYNNLIPVDQLESTLRAAQ